MPYIQKERREQIIITGDIPAIDICEIKDGGELQYAIAVLAKSLLSRLPNNYASREMIMGALSGADKEFYRRHVAGYEDFKKEGNGDVETIS